jgi:hypothetical protein
MKQLKKVKSSLSEIGQQLKKFKSLLDSKSSLGETELLDFFKRNQPLIPRMVLDTPQLVEYDYAASEYDLFGDFRCDFVVGSGKTRKPVYCFVEFEDAEPDSVFKKKSGRHASEWAPKLEHGFSQLVDWFYQLEDMKQTDNYRNRFGEHPEFCGLLVIGRNEFLNEAERKRFD